MSHPHTTQMKRNSRFPTPASLEKLLSASQLLLGWEDTLRPRGPAIGFQQAHDASPAKEPTLKPVWLDNPESHAICVAPTGSGKGRCSLIPQLLSWKGSTVVIDPKGEAAAVTGRYRERELGQRVVYLDPFHLVTDKPDALNPLDAIQFSGESPEEFAIMAPSLLHPDHTGFAREPYWDNSGDALISAVLCYILAMEAPEHRNFPRLRTHLMSDDVVYNLARLLDTVGSKMPSMAHEQLASFVSTADLTRSGILSTAQQHLRLLGDPCVCAGLRETTFDLEAFRRGDPMTIYLILPPSRLYSHGLLLRSWLGTLFTVAMSREQLPDSPTLFLVDELAALGSMSQIRTAFTLLRGYGVRVTIYLQDLNQLKQLYTQDWETLVNNAGTIQTFSPSNFKMAQQLAEFFGTEVRPDDMLRAGKDEQFILFQGGQFKRCRKLDYLTDPFFAGRYEVNPRYKRRPPPDLGAM